MRDSKNHANLDGEGLNPVRIFACFKKKYTIFSMPYASR